MPTSPSLVQGANAAQATSNAGVSLTPGDVIFKAIQMAIQQASQNWPAAEAAPAPAPAPDVPEAATRVSNAPLGAPTITEDEIAAPTMEDPVGQAMVAEPEMAVNPQAPATAAPASTEPTELSPVPPPPPPPSPMGVERVEAEGAETVPTVTPEATEAPSTEEPTPTATPEEDKFRDLGLEDMLSPELLSQLQDAAAGKKMSTSEVIALAGLAMANPEMAQTVLAQRQQDKTTARSLLTQMSTQAAIANRQMRNRKDEIDRTTTTQNMIMVRQAFSAVRSVGGTPEPFTGDYSDSQAVQEYLSKLHQEHAEELFPQQVWQEDYPQFLEMAQTGPDPEFLNQAIRERLARKLPPDQVDSLVKANAALLENVAKQARGERLAEQGIARGELEIARARVRALENNNALRVDLLQRELTADRRDELNRQLAQMREEEMALLNQTTSMQAQRLKAADTKTEELITRALGHYEGALANLRVTMAATKQALYAQAPVSPAAIAAMARQQGYRPGGAIHVSYSNQAGQQVLPEEAIARFMQDLAMGNTGPGSPARESIISMMSTAILEAGDSDLARQDMLNFFEEQFEGGLPPNTPDPISEDMKRNLLQNFDRRLPQGQ